MRSCIRRAITITTYERIENRVKTYGIFNTISRYIDQSIVERRLYALYSLTISSAVADTTLTIISMGFKTTRIARVWTLKRPFNGEPCADDFALTEEQLPPIEDGQLVCEAEYLSVDPYMRVKMASACGAFPAPMIGTQVAK